MRLLLLCALLLPLAASAQEDGDDGAGFEVPSRLLAPPLGTARPLPVEGDLLATAKRAPDGGLTLRQGEKEEALTIDPWLQEQLKGLMRTYQTPYAAVVAIEPSTGRVLAMAEHSEANPAMNGLCTRPLYPAASIFKVVTAAALLEAGVKPDDATCFHGGKRSVSESELVDSARDTRCETMTTALGHSLNVVFAKLTARFLDAEHLRATARALHFNVPLPFPVPTQPSLASIPDETLPLSLTGAGFGDVFLSPLHGAALAAVAANHGQWRAPVLFERDVGVRAPEQALAPAAAEALATMMEETVKGGTARRIFHERGMGVPGAAGKTGSLADKRPFRDYTWFVGFAPREAPKVAVAAVIVNDPHWRIRATWLGREAMRLFLTRGR
jgi:cell division protein FtsI/penicillin-binding protein 2